MTQPTESQALTGFAAINYYVHNRGSSRLFVEGNQLRCVPLDQSGSHPVTDQEAVAARVMDVMREPRNESTSDFNIYNLEQAVVQNVTISPSFTIRRSDAQCIQAVKQILFPLASSMSSTPAFSSSSSSSSSQSLTTIPTVLGPTVLGRRRRGQEVFDEEADAGHHTQRARIETPETLLAQYLPRDAVSIVAQYTTPNTLRSVAESIQSLPLEERKARFLARITNPEMNTHLVNQLYSEGRGVSGMVHYLQGIFPEMGKAQIDDYIYQILLGIASHPNPQIHLGMLYGTILLGGHDGLTEFRASLSGISTEQLNVLKGTLSLNAGHWLRSIHVTSCIKGVHHIAEYTDGVIRFVKACPQEQRMTIFQTMMRQPGGNAIMANRILRESHFTIEEMRQHPLIREIFGTTNNMALQECIQNIYDHHLDTLRMTPDCSHIEDYIRSSLSQVDIETGQEMLRQLLTTGDSAKIVNAFLAKHGAPEISYESMRNDAFLRELFTTDGVVNEAGLQQFLRSIIQSMFAQTTAREALVGRLLRDPLVIYNLTRIRNATSLRSLFRTKEGVINNTELQGFIEGTVKPSLSQLSTLNLHRAVPLPQDQFIALCRACPALTAFENFRSLNISPSAMAAGVNCLPQLTRLSLPVGAMDPCLSSITQPERMQELNLILNSDFSREPGFSSVIMQDIARFTQLQRLSFCSSCLLDQGAVGGGLRDNDLQHLLPLTELQELNLSGHSDLTDACIDTLLRLPIQSVNLTGCDQITSGAVQRLRERGIVVDRGAVRRSSVA